MSTEEKTIALSRNGESIEIISRLPVLPVRDLVMFPFMMTTLLIGRDRSLSSLERALKEEKLLFLVTQKDPDNAEPAGKDLYRVGCVVTILQLLRLGDGSAKVVVEGLGRASVRRYITRGKRQEVLLRGGEPPSPTLDADLEALVRTVRNAFAEYVTLQHRLPDDLLSSVQEISSPVRLAHVVGAHMIIPINVKQSLLEEFDIRRELEFLAYLLAQELDILRLEKKIEDEVKNQVQKNQREFYLSEQLRAIQKELGQDQDESDEIAEMEDQIKRARMPKKVKEKAEHELDRLKRLPPMGPETGVIQQYIDWLVHLPWNHRSRGRIDISVAERILDEDHYGLKKVKERIIEYLSVLKLVKKMKGPILCLVGPPGVGKTSLGKSIARALNRKFVRISLGGVRDEAEIRGHRRTYVGAMPGRIIQSIRKAGTRNPVFIVDEVDKMSVDFRGDPSAALLEVLDPEQNDSFSDHYLEVEFDLSEVLFVTTANTTHAIPPALRDRMEVIRMPGYLRHEKIAIAQGFLMPKLQKSHGLTSDQYKLTPTALHTVIGRYTRESGVRELERNLATLARKVATHVARRNDNSFPKITPGRLASFLGAPRFRENEIEDDRGPGIATGLAWTEVGGELLTVEVMITPGKGELQLTGQLGDVMKESARAALTYIRNRAELLGLDSRFHMERDIHIHIPEGAIPKDGPSAGITMATAIVSALLGQATKGTLAMTGEVTLRGRVLPVGGLAEKIVAAQRGGVSDIIVPADNKRELKEVPTEAKRGIKFHFVSSMDEVIALAFESNPLASDGSRA